MKPYCFLMAMSVAGAMSFAITAQAHDMDGGMMHHHMMGTGACMQTLPAEKQKMMKDEMHRNMEQDKSSFERMHQLHEKLMTIGTADKFDRKAFISANNEMAALHMKMEKRGGEMMASMAEKLTADERRGMAKCMEGEMHHGKFRHEEERGENETTPASHNDYGTLNK